MTRQGEVAGRKKLKSGWLTKKGHLVKNWKKRYIVVTYHSLTYFTDSVLSNKRGEFVFDSNAQICVANFPDTTSKPYRFALQNLTSGAYLELCAGNRKEKLEWIDALERVIRGDPFPEKDKKTSKSEGSRSTSVESSNNEEGSLSKTNNIAETPSNKIKGNSKQTAEELFMASESDDEDEMSKTYFENESLQKVKESIGRSVFLSDSDSDSAPDKCNYESKTRSASNTPGRDGDILEGEESTNKIHLSKLASSQNDSISISSSDWDEDDCDDVVATEHRSSSPPPPPPINCSGQSNRTRDTSSILLGDELPDLDDLIIHD